MKIEEIKVGDRIKFKAITRWSSRAVWRKVVSVKRWPAMPGGWRKGESRVRVRYGGWPDFLVEDREIIDHVSEDRWPSGTAIACENNKNKP